MSRYVYEVRFKPAFYRVRSVAEPFLYGASFLPARPNSDSFSLIGSNFGYTPPPPMPHRQFDPWRMSEGAPVWMEVRAHGTGEILFTSEKAGGLPLTCEHGGQHAPGSSNFNSPLVSGHTTVITTVFASARKILRNEIVYFKVHGGIFGVTSQPPIQAWLFGDAAWGISPPYSMPGAPIMTRAQCGMLALDGFACNFNQSAPSAPYSQARDFEFAIKMNMDTVPVAWVNPDPLAPLPEESA